MDSFDPKSPEEKDTFAFVFTPRLLADETLVSCTFSIEMLAGNDPDKDQMLSGGALVNQTAVSVKTAGGGTITIPAKVAIMQSVMAGLHGCDYELIAKAETSTGRNLSKHAHLPVRNEGS